MDLDKVDVHLVIVEKKKKKKKKNKKKKSYAHYSSVFGRG
jgi:hypothetical protein